MGLKADEVKRIKAMRHDELLENAQSQDFAVVVEAALRLHRVTKCLNWVLIGLTVVLIFLTGALVYYARISN
jgi:hypothetical protein